MSNLQVPSVTSLLLGSLKSSLEGPLEGPLKAPGTEPVGLSFRQ